MAAGAFTCFGADTRGDYVDLGPLLFVWTVRREDENIGPARSGNIGMVLQELNEGTQSAYEAITFIIAGVVRHGHQIIFAVLVRTL